MTTTTIPMYGAHIWQPVGAADAVAYCARCDWSRTYPKCTVRRAMAYARRHYYAHHA